MNINDKFFDWTVKKFHNYGVVCECKCGTLQWIAKNKLINGKSKKCRLCSNKEKSECNIKHGFARRKNRGRIYTIWNLMLRRCYKNYDPQYHNYGGRGIIVCDRWHRFENFLEDMQEPPKNHVIDRIDFNGNYEKNNCRWIHLVDSAKNTRSCKYYMVNDKKMTQHDTALALKTSKDTLKNYAKKMGSEQAIEYLMNNDWSKRNKMLKNHPYHKLKE